MTTMALPTEIRDPMVLGVLARRDLDADALPVTSVDAVQGAEHETSDEDGPRIHATGDLIEIRWQQEDGDAVLEIARLTNGTWLRSVTVESAAIPETVRLACVGENLARIVGLDDADTYRIAGYVAAGPMTRFFVEAV